MGKVTTTLTDKQGNSINLESSYSVQAAGPVEPTAPDLVSITTLGTGTFTQKAGRTPSGKGISFPPGVISDPDFAVPSNYPVYCHFIPSPTKLVGSGMYASIIEPRANSMGQPAKDKQDVTVEPNTNPYTLIRVDKAALVQDLTIRGTTQGTSAKTGKPYAFHGIQFYGTNNPVLRRVRLQDIIGWASVPPGETFAGSAYQCTGTWLIEDVLVDNTTLSSGAGITYGGASPSPFGIHMKRLVVKNRPNGAGFTCFNRPLKSFVAEDCLTDGSMVAFNFEHVIVNGGAKVNNAKDSGIVLIRPQVKNPSKTIPDYSHLTIDSSLAGGGVSNRVDIHDPILAPGEKFGVTISKGYGYAMVPGGAQAQRGADIHLWVGNTERPDLIHWWRTQGAA